MIDYLVWIPPMAIPLIAAACMADWTRQAYAIGTLVCVPIARLVPMADFVGVNLLTTAVWIIPIIAPLLLLRPRLRLSHWPILPILMALMTTAMGIAGALTLMALSHNSGGEFCDPTTPAEMRNFHSGAGDCRIRVLATADFFVENLILIFGIGLGNLAIPFLGAAAIAKRLTRWMPGRFAS